MTFLRLLEGEAMKPFHQSSKFWRTHILLKLS
jgi:hypothetical protein